ncbi:MAG: zinc ribbon domain-containing protein [Gemmatimonadota bacterium]|nr:MAG: zinc ribbon domain-containing protein [Gemmatimonadota bacterium]
MDDLERLLDTLVQVLRQSDPKRVTRPFQVSELYQSILPYRQFKNQLQLDTNQDYEMAVLRLLAGEGGYASVQPPEVQQQLADEAQAINPDPGLFREFAAARVLLNLEAVKSIKRTGDAYAPPGSGAEIPAPTPHHPPPAPTDRKTPPIFEPVEEPTPEHAAPAPEAVTRPAETDSIGCPACSKSLPQQRAITFCPFCGERIGITPCTKCGEDIEPGWLFCVSCGTSANRG